MSTVVHNEPELESFYAAYIEAFNREDTELFARSFSYPYAWIDGARGLTVCAHEDDHRRTFALIMRGLKERGWASSRADRVTSWVMADKLAMVLADVTRYRNDGSILEQVRACYTVRREAGSWKIVTVAEIRPPYLGPGEFPR
ncbi:MAG: DUF6841 family protein [Candidatus Binataceae bacterium]